MLKDLFRGIVLMSPDGADGAGAGDGSKKDEGAAPTKIKVGDKELTAEEVAEAMKAQAEAKKLVAANRVLYDGSKTPEERAEAARVVLAANGHSDAAINRWIAENITGGDDDNDDASPPKQTKRGADDDTSDIMKGLEKDLDQTRKEVRQTRIENLNRVFSTDLEKVFEKDPQVKTLLDAADRINGPEKKSNRVKVLKDQIKASALSILNQRTVATGESLKADWIEPAIQEATTAVVDRYSSLFGSADGLAKSMSPSDGGNPFVNRKPVPEPKFDGKMNVGDLEQHVEAWLSDQLGRLATEMPSKTGSAA